MYWILGLLAAVIGALTVGLRVRPKPFPPFPQAQPALSTVPLRADLPPPVARWFHTVFGDRVPLITSAVVSGRGKLIFMGIPFESRWRFTHVAGQGYRHYMEAMLFGRPLMRVNEHYLDGVGHMEIPVGTFHDTPYLNSAANLGLWAETMYLPSLFVTDPRVRWEAVDDVTARLYVPYAGGEQCFTVVFDPHTGLLHHMEVMRHRDAVKGGEILWRCEVYGWQTTNGACVPSPSGAHWMDQKSPWLNLDVDEVVYNVDVSSYIRQRGL